ncbi:NRDE family protein [Lujinxingia vulgaris]|uniref:NRDE family protein n=1 Tax=Lujinxingia vulgaris TaxID=2600176 RepID=A0A5C6XEK1_9DELT|nr:NRDE family protein [Lujinxingia vulgaris]TXD38239.1 NRDE family protein [Lujinxingia vulgaris]
MCTILIATRCAPDCPLFVVANRDESYVRPASSPALREIGGMRVLAPRDERSGGSWLGLNEAGIFVAITNRFEVERRPHHRSRGELVWQSLGRASVEEALEGVRGLSPADYGGFHLLLADETRAQVIWSDGEVFREEVLAPGYHALSERSFGAGASKRLERLARQLPGQRPLNDGMRRSLIEAMAWRDEEHPFESTCVHMPELDYGTRSSTLVALGERVRFEHAEGPPCEADYVSYAAELKALGL